MTVKELMARLSELPPDDEIVVKEDWDEIHKNASVSEPRMEKLPLYGYKSARGNIYWQVFPVTKDDAVKSVWIIGY